MNKFYLVVIKSDSQSIASYDSRDAVTVAFHSELAYAISAHIDTTCMITDGYGTVMKHERYANPNPEPEEVPEEIAEE